MSKGSSNFPTLIQIRFFYVYDVIAEFSVHKSEPDPWLSITILCYFKLSFINDEGKLIGHLFLTLKCSKTFKSEPL